MYFRFKGALKESFHALQVPLFVFLLDLQLFLCFSKAFPKGEKVNLAFSITLLWSGDSVSSTVRYSYLSSVLPDT